MENLVEKFEKVSQMPIEEGRITKAIEHQTSKIPSTYFLAAAGGAVVLSLGMAAFSQRKGWANVVGNLVPSLLLLGIYNKIVKTHGSDAEETQTIRKDPQAIKNYKTRNVA